MAELDAEVDAIAAFLSAPATTTTTSTSTSSRTVGSADGCADMCAQAWDEARIIGILRAAIRSDNKEGIDSHGDGDGGSAALNALYDALIGPPPPPATATTTAAATSGSISGDMSSPAPDSSKSLKAQFDAATRDLNRVYEDVLTAYTHQQSLQSLCASLHDALAAQSLHAEAAAGGLRARLLGRAEELGRARRWARLMAQAREEIKVR
jgi:hypothetical protein